MFEDMMGKFQEMKLKVEESKKRLDTITIDAEAGGGAVKVTISGNKEIRKIDINEELFKGDKEELEEILVVAVNRAIQQAEKVHEAEMQGATKGILPNLPGMG